MKLNYILIGIIVLFAALRFIDIEADFPQKFIDGGFVLTDEGWYCNGATSKILTGTWVSDAFQSMPVIPVNHILQYINMSVFGVSSATLRYSMCVFFLVFIFIMYLVCKRLYDPLSALVALIPLVTSGYLFAYSRIGLIDIEMLMMISVSILMAVYKRPVLSSVFMIVALLTKTSAMFAIVPIGYLLYKQIDIKKAIIYISIVIGIYGFYMLSVKSSYPEVFNTFFSSNISGRAKISVYSAVNKIISFDIVLFLSLCVALSGFEIKKNVFNLMLLLFGFAMISMNGYQPNRYFIVLVPAVCMIIASGMYELKDKRKFIYIITGICLLFNGVDIYQMFKSRQHTLRNCFKALSNENVKGPISSTAMLYTSKVSKDKTCYVLRYQDREMAKNIKATSCQETVVYGQKLFILR
jgi:4-amino-4-deoxy-L-arabinose transferase-like glycosyltransferase